MNSYLSDEVLINSVGGCRRFSYDVSVGTTSPRLGSYSRNHASHTYRTRLSTSTSRSMESNASGVFGSLLVWLGNRNYKLLPKSPRMRSVSGMARGPERRTCACTSTCLRRHAWRRPAGVRDAACGEHVQTRVKRVAAANDERHCADCGVKHGEWCRVWMAMGPRTKRSQRRRTASSSASRAFARGQDRAT